MDLGCKSSVGAWFGGGLQSGSGVGVDVHNLNCDGTIESPN